MANRIETQQKPRIENSRISGGSLTISIDSRSTMATMASSTASSTIHTASKGCKTPNMTVVASSSTRPTKTRIGRFMRRRNSCRCGSVKSSPSMAHRPIT